MSAYLKIEFRSDLYCGCIQMLPIKTEDAMADENTDSVGVMRNSPVDSDIGEDMGGTDVQKEDEEEVDRDPNYMEDRFRVDRRKLEQMIQGTSSTFQFSHTLS